MKLAKTLDIQPKDFTKDIYWRGETYQDDDSLLKLADLKKFTINLIYEIQDLDPELDYHNYSAEQFTKEVSFFNRELIKAVFPEDKWNEAIELFERKEES